MFVVPSAEISTDFESMQSAITKYTDASKLTAQAAFVLFVRTLNKYYMSLNDLQRVHLCKLTANISI